MLSRRPSFVMLSALAFGAPFADAAHAQVPPNPRAFVSQLDLECHAATGAPPVAEVLIRQLNPVLLNRLPNQVAKLGALEDVCVPVAKNGQVPGPGMLPIARWVDLACYQASAAPVDVEVDLSHLNPVLSGLPDEAVKLVALERLCVPVRKVPVGGGGPVMPPAIRNIVSHIDVACYGLEEATSSAEVPLALSHLNPIIQAQGLAERHVRMKEAGRLCVPVAKGNQVVPPGIRSLVEWVDFLEYDIVPSSAAAVAAYEAPIPLTLAHLNPLFAAAAPFLTVLRPELTLMVPVAKDGQLPPD